MGNVLISLDDESEAYLRREARETYGGRKGALSATVQAGLAALREKERKESIRQDFLQTIRKGMNLGLKGNLYKNRGELYDR